MTLKRPHRRARKTHDEGHVDDWLMTYADMITLLICFFAVFLSVSVPKKEQFNRARQEMIEKFSGGGPHAIDMPLDKTVIQIPPPPKNDVPFESLNSIVGRYNVNVEKAVEIRQGDTITTIEMNSAAFFGSGQASLNPEGIKLMDELAGGIAAPRYSDYTITVEGHTDDVPIANAQFPSNWELSASRAATVVRFLIEKGIPPAKLKAAGYADTFPKLPNRMNGGQPIPENQAQNRRVVIKLEKIRHDDTPEQ